MGRGRKFTIGVVTLSHWVFLFGVSRGIRGFQ